MTALLIILSVLAVLLILLLCDVSVLVEYNKELTVRIKYLFFQFKVFPVKKDKKAKGKKDKQASSSMQSKSGDVFGSFELTVDIVKDIIVRLLRFLGKFRLTTLKVYADVAGEDAAACAIKTGAFNALVYTFVGWLNSQIVVKDPDIRISANYNGDTNYYFYAEIKVKPIHSISVGLGFILSIIKNTFNKDGAVQ